MHHIKGTPFGGLTGATLGFFFGFASVALFGPTATRFQEPMALTPEQVGFLVAVPALSGSLLRIPFAAWVDTTGGRKPFLVLLSLSLMGMLGLALLVNFARDLGPGLYPLVLFLGVLCGCGIATFSVGIGQVAYWFTMEGQGKALGIYAGVGNLAPGIFSFLLPVALSSLGLEGAYLLWFLFLACGTAGYFFFARNAPYFQLLEQGVPEREARQEAREHGQQLLPAGSLRESLFLSARVWKTWVLVALYFTTFGGFIALTAWFPVYWQSFHGVGPVTAGLLTALYSVLTSVMRVFGGAVADRLGGENTVLGSLAVMLAGAALTAGSGTFAPSVAGVVIMSVGMGIGNAAIFKLVPQEVPQAVGGAAGWVGGLGAFGGVVLPPALGLFVRLQGPQGYARGFLIFAALAAAALLLAWGLKVSRRT